MHRQTMRRLRMQYGIGRKEAQEWRMIMRERSGPGSGRRVRERTSCTGRRSKFPRRILSVLEL